MKVLIKHKTMISEQNGWLGIVNYEHMVADLLGQRVSLASGSLLMPGRLVTRIGIFS